MHASIGSRTVNGRACGVVRCHFLTRGVFCSLTLSYIITRVVTLSPLSRSRVADFLAVLSPRTSARTIKEIEKEHVLVLGEREVYCSCKIV